MVFVQFVLAASRHPMGSLAHAQVGIALLLLMSWISLEEGTSTCLFVVVVVVVYSVLSVHPIVSCICSGSCCEIIWACVSGMSPWISAMMLQHSHCQDPYFLPQQGKLRCQLQIWKGSLGSSSARLSQACPRTSSLVHGVCVNIWLIARIPNKLQSPGSPSSAWWVMWSSPLRHN